MINYFLFLKLVSKIYLYCNGPYILSSDICRRYISHKSHI